MLQFIKQSLKSRTIKFNLVFMAADAMLMLLDVALGLDVVKNNPEYLKIAVGLQSLGNIILRYKTKTSVGDK